MSELRQRKTIAEEARSVLRGEEQCKEAEMNMLRAMNDSNHSWDAAGGYTREEVDYAFHNHGAHQELLHDEVTDIAGHYVLLHFDAQSIDASAYKLRIDGLVHKPREFTLAEIMQRPAETHAVVMECAGSDRVSSVPRFNKHSPWGLQPISQAQWTGCNLMDLIKEECGGLLAEAVDLKFSGADKGVDDGKVIRYERSLNIRDDAILADVMLVWAMNGAPLPKKHGFPLRLLVPGWYGMASVKYLIHICAVDHRCVELDAMQKYSYSIHPRDPELKQPVTVQRPRAILRLPGLAEFFTGRRFCEKGRIKLEGRAWVGGATVRKTKQAAFIESVGLSFDKGVTWVAAELEPQRHGPWSWQYWSYEWQQPTPGDFTIIVQATDNSGVQQAVWPDPRAAWDYRSMAGVPCQRLVVHVVDSLRLNDLVAPSEPPHLRDRRTY